VKAGVWPQVSTLTSSRRLGILSSCREFPHGVAVRELNPDPC
jgi:hypothetical protein